MQSDSDCTLSCYTVTATPPLGVTTPDCCSCLRWRCTREEQIMFSVLSSEYRLYDCRCLGM